MKYYNTIFKSLLKATGNRDSYLVEVPYRRSVPLIVPRSEGGPVEGPVVGPSEAIFTMTDSGVDREGDVILAAGVDSDWFATYGSILWGHRADEPRFVLGSPAEVMREENRILVRAKFADENANPDAARVFKMIEAGIVRAMSVGVMIREYSEAGDRAGFMPLNITQSELIETSVTPVPINPRAVLQAVGEDKGSEESRAVAELFEEVADSDSETKAAAEDSGLTVDVVKDLIHETIGELVGNRIISLPTSNRAAPDTAADALEYYARLAAQTTERDK